MGLLDTLKRAFGGSAATPAQPQRTSPASEPEPEAIRVPEMTAVELIAERRRGGRTVLLDCREEHEWRQVRIPDSLHIPMRQIPGRVAEIERSADVVVVCAHGNRSYSVAGWLIEQGFRARSLRGGVAAWQQCGGEVESERKPASRP